VILPGKTAAENNVPAGPRLYVICDANQPNIVWLKNAVVPVMAQDINIAVRGVPPKVFIEPVP
jgi:hypothetical protein